MSVRDMTRRYRIGAIGQDEHGPYVEIPGLWLEEFDGDYKRLRIGDEITVEPLKPSVRAYRRASGEREAEPPDRDVIDRDRAERGSE